jgi:putative CocE/NonD family hydrolase
MRYFKHPPRQIRDEGRSEQEGTIMKLFAQILDRLLLGLRSVSGTRQISFIIFVFLLLSFSQNTLGRNTPPAGSKPEKISLPNLYKGYSDVLYTDHVRHSQYAAGAGGTPIAIDIYRPAAGGVPVDKPMPVILIHYVMKPRVENEGGLEALKEEGVFDMLGHGYVVIWIQQRGSGASFGPQIGFVTPTNGADIKSIVAWAAKQPWSTGKVGMMGGSHGGYIQYMAAAAQPPELVAITPAVTTTSFYSVSFPGGVSSMGQPGQPGVPETEDMYPDFNYNSYSVDADVAPDFPLLQAAAKSQAGNVNLQQEYLVNMHRDTFSPSVGYAPALVDAPINYESQIRSSGIRVYNLTGWYDLSTHVQVIDYRLYGGKLLIGPWVHVVSNPMMIVERLRWFDRFLQGIDNGVDREPPVYYYTINAPDGHEWNFAADWPLVNEVRTRFYLDKGRTGTIASQNDGNLSLSIPKQAGAFDSYKVDLNVEAFDGQFNRLERTWDGDMSGGVDSHGLTYTTPPLEQDTEITGHPVVHLWVTSTAKDGNFVAWIDDIGPDGKSLFVSDGALRGSHRNLTSKQPWDDMGLPYHASTAADSIPLPQVEPTELLFDAYPMSYVFKKGHRIRLTVTGGEKNTYQQPPGFDRENPPTIRVYRGGDHASYVDFPIIPANSKYFVGTASVKTVKTNYTGPSQLYLGSERAFLRLGNEWIDCIRPGERRVAQLPSAFSCDREGGAMNVRITKNKGGGHRATITGPNVNFEGDIP